MILIDTSVWIDLLGRAKRFHLNEAQFFQATICPPIIQEVLQGIRWDTHFGRLKEGLLALPCVDPVVPLNRYVEAAEIFRLGRSKGYSIRSGIDCLIAAIAIKHQLPIFHQDRDFDFITKYTSLKVLHRL